MLTNSTRGHLAMALGVALLLLGARASAAGELYGLGWAENRTDETLLLQVDGAPRVETASMDQGYRLRVTLIESLIDDHVVEIGGRGIVRGVFPYVSDDGRSVYIDFLLSEPGTLRVEPFSDGYAVTAMGMREVREETDSAPAAVQAPLPAVTQVPEAPLPAVTHTPAAPPAAPGANRIEDIRFSTLPGDRVQIDIRMARQADEPGSFSTNDPPRIALDFFNTTNALGRDVVPINTGAVESIAAVQTDDRTRLVLNLVRPSAFEKQVTPDGITLLISDTRPAASRAPSQFDLPALGVRNNVQRIDFRRGADGEGQVIVDLSAPDVGVDVREQAGEIIIEFTETELPDALERRLDVVDFATPVRTIDAFRHGDRTRLVVTPVGRYQHIAYQTGNIFTLQVRPVLESEEDLQVDEFGYSGERLTLNFQNITVRAALQVIADFTGLNFVTSDSVTGELTLRLQDVPWDQALDIILQTKGLDKRQAGNVIWVAPAAEIAARERQQLEALQQTAELEPLTSELIEINYARASDIAQLLRSIRAVETGIQPSLFGGVTVGQVETESNTLLSERGSVTVDTRTNSLLIQDTPGKIRQIRQLIAQLDKPVRQVMIETRIVEANDDFSRNLGARLGFQRVVQDAHFPGASGSNLGTVIGSGTLGGTETINQSLLNDDGVIEFDTGSSGLGVQLPASGIGNFPAASYALDIFRSGTGFANLLSLEISALEAQGRGRIIANPRLITANQQEASIEQGQERIFTTSVLGQGSVVTKKAVLSLTVTPQITPDDRVILDVFITQDSFVSAVDPTINTKQINTQVLLDNGDTVVIGGIYQQSESTNVTKVPILGDIPLIGALFRQRGVRDDRTELLIFLTPRIISPALDLG